MEVVVKCCIICAQPRVKSEPQSQIEVSQLLPGANESALLNDQLCTYFVARKLLKLSPRRCLQFASHFQKSSPASWFQTFCNGCGDIVVQALDLHKRLLMIMGEIEGFGKTLQLMVKNSSQTKREDGDGVWFEIRGLLGAHGDEDETLQSHDLLVEGQCSNNDNDDVAWSGGEDYNSGGDDRMIGHESTGDQVKNVKESFSTSDRRRNNKVSYKSYRNSSGSDSDYEPERPKRTKILKKRKFETRPMKTTEAGYQCDLCQSFYTTLHGFKRHLQVDEESKKLGSLFDCPKCNHPNLSEEKLRRHLTKIHETLENTCSICGNVSHRRWLLEKHMLEQHNIKLWTPIAEREGNEGDTVGSGIDLKNSKPNMENQIKEVQLEENSHEQTDNKSRLSSVAKSFLSKSKILSLGAQSSVGIACRLCKSVYKTFNGFRLHVDQHNESKTRFHNKFDCPKCNHPNLSEEKLRRHLTKVHETVKNTCSICGKVSQRRGHHEKHMLTQHNIKIWTPISEKTASTNEDETKAKSNDENETYKLQSPIHQSNSNDDEIVSGADDSENNVIQKPMLREKRRRTQNVPDLQFGSDLSADEDRKAGSDDEWSGAGEGSGISEDSASAPSNNESDDDFNIKSTRKSGSSDLYTCEVCKSVYKSDRGYQRHQQEHKISKELNHMYDCEICGFPNSCERKLRYHKKRAHQEIVKIKCTICSFEALRPNQLRLHMKKHNPSYKRGVHTGRPRKNNFGSANFRSDGKIECKLCKAIYSGPECYARHVKVHEQSNANNNQFDCDVCKFPCTSESRLQRHKSCKHQKTLPTCLICDQAFVRPNLLKAHMKYHEENDGERDDATGQYFCKYCNEGFPSMRGIQTHKLVMHQSEMAATGKCFLCSDCGQCFSTVALLRKHVKTKHENNYRYTCETCGKGFENKYCIESHRLIHNENRTQEFVCEVCGVAYSHTRSLEQHKVKFHPDAVGRKIYSKLANGPVKEGVHKCKWCGMVFPFKYALIRHIPAVHKDLYNFNCDDCGKAYISASSLRLHKEIAHTDGTKQYSCEYCGKLFPHKHYVICHYKWCRKKADTKKKEPSTSKSLKSSRPAPAVENYNSSESHSHPDPGPAQRQPITSTSSDTSQEPQWKSESLSSYSSSYYFSNLYSK